MRRVFESKLLIELAKDNLIYKIDESSFIISLKIKRYWLPRGKPGGLLNITSYGRCWLIFCNRIWWKEDKNDKNEYYKINKLFKISNSSGYLMALRRISVKWNLILTIDNASIHSSKAINSLVSRLMTNLWFV